MTDGDGTIHSAGNTVLGADDVSGIVSILEALTVIQESKTEHPDIEVLITAAEEINCALYCHSVRKSFFSSITSPPLPQPGDSRGFRGKGWAEWGSSWFVLLSVSVYEWGRTLEQHISTAGFVGRVPTDAPTRKKTG